MRYLQALVLNVWMHTYVGHVGSVVGFCAFCPEGRRFESHFSCRRRYWVQLKMIISLSSHNIWKMFLSMGYYTAVGKGLSYALYQSFWLSMSEIGKVVTISRQTVRSGLFSTCLISGLFSTCLYQQPLFCKVSEVIVLQDCWLKSKHDANHSTTKEFSSKYAAYWESPFKIMAAFNFLSLSLWGQVSRFPTQYLPPTVGR